MQVPINLLPPPPDTRQTSQHRCATRVRGHRVILRRTSDAIAIQPCQTHPPWISGRTSVRHRHRTTTIAAAQRFSRYPLQPVRRRKRGPSPQLPNPRRIGSLGPMSRRPGCAQIDAHTQHPNNETHRRRERPSQIQNKQQRQFRCHGRMTTPSQRYAHHAQQRHRIRIHIAPTSR